MHVAVVGQDSALTDLCAFAARRRGHNVVCMDSPDRLFGNLPFTPALTVIEVREVDDRTVSAIAKISETFPQMNVFVTAERGGRKAFKAIEAGALDVIDIPYNPTELIARAEQLGARAASSTVDSESIEVADLEVDLGKYAARKNGNSMTLTKLELRLLYCLCAHHPHLASTERLLSFGWEGSLEADPALIKTHISHIRAKMAKAGGTPMQIRSRQTLGYELVV